MAREARNLHRMLAAAKVRKLLPADASLPEDERPSWVLLALSFFGAQLAVWPFLLFLALTLGDWLAEPWGALLVGAGFLAGSLAVLRSQGKSMFLSQLGFMILLAGLGLWCWALFRFDLGVRLLALVLAASMLVLAWLARVPWVQSVLGVFFALVFAYVDWMGVQSPDAFVGHAHQWLGAPFTLNMWVLSGLWWLWCARESRWGAAAWPLKAHAFMSGLAVGLLLLVCKDMTHLVWLSTALGSADVDGAGAMRLLHFNLWSAGASLLALASGVWLLFHWGYLPLQRTQKAQNTQNARAPALPPELPGLPELQLPERSQPLPPEHALWLVLYGLWAFLAFVVPNMGVLAVLFGVAWGTGRRRMLVLTLLVLLAQLASFYYALQWPLAHKAALLAAVGGALALALGCIHLWGQRTAVAAAGPVDEKHARTGRRDTLAWRAGLAASLLLALALTQWDAQKKEQVLAHGQTIYMPLAPIDPRSLMQGDYMALRFDLPDALLDGDADSPHAHRQRGLNPLRSPALVVARLDAKGIATLQRRYQKSEPLAADEVIVPLKYMKGNWVVVTDAYFFPEGHGRVFNNARYGEFRVLGQGKVLLAGLADEKLQRIDPRPDQPQADETAQEREGQADAP